MFLIKTTKQNQNLVCWSSAGCLMVIPRFSKGNGGAANGFKDPPFGEVPNKVNSPSFTSAPKAIC
jgi:hypothetical protein